MQSVKKHRTRFQSFQNSQVKEFLSTTCNSNRSEMVFHRCQSSSFAELFPKRHPARDTLSKRPFLFEHLSRNLPDHWGNSYLTSIHLDFRFCNSLLLSFNMAIFAQTVLRTGRLALSRAGASNPIQQALGYQGAAKYASAYRNYATAFERSKPHVNIGMVELKIEAIGIS